MLVIVLLVSFFLLLFIGVPISFALSISSFTAVMTTGAIPVINLVQKTFRAIDSFTLLAIPFFVFAGNVMARGGVSKRLTDMAAANQDDSVFFLHQKQNPSYRFRRPCSRGNAVLHLLWRDLRFRPRYYFRYRRCYGA